MFGKILKLLIATVIVGYTIFTLAVIPSHKKSGDCKGMVVSVSDNGTGIIGKEDIANIIYKEGLDPTGKRLDEFLCNDVEELINRISLIDECQVYKSYKGYVKVFAKIKTPILKIQDKDNRIYYIDKKGDIIHGIKKALYLPVANGHIDDSIAMNEARLLATTINESKFWNSQIEQIYFDKEGKVTMIPRVGDHVIEFGKVNDVENKLEKLYTFYNEGLNRVGWNKYSKINIEFGDKVICTKNR